MSPRQPAAAAAAAPPPSAGSDGGSGIRYGTPQGRWVLAATVLGSALASIDATVVGIALPAIGRDFGASVASLQWVVNAYTLALAGLLLISGSAGDLYGRKRFFITGVIWFAVASALCGLAPTAPLLIAARGLQGVGAALLTPGSLAILQASFAPADRGRAIGAWSGLGGVATAIGPFLGGWLVSAVSWRLIFAINPPLAALVVVLALRHVPESRDPSKASTRLDYTGGALATLGLTGLTYGLIQGPSTNWGPSSTVVLILGVLLLVLFVLWERRVPTPILPLSLFSSRQFTVTNAVTFVMYGATGGVFFLLPIQLQEVSGYSPLEAGISVLPLTAVTLLLSARSGALAERIGPRLQMGVGPLLVGASLFLLVRIDAAGTYVTQVLPAVLVLGLGFSVTVAPLTATALSSAPPTQTGTASAVNNDVARTASLIAVAVLPVIAGITGTAYDQPEVFSAGFHKASVVSGALCLVAGLTAALLIRNPSRAAAPEPAAATRAYSHCALDAPPPRTRAS